MGTHFTQISSYGKRMGRTPVLSNVWENYGKKLPIAVLYMPIAVLYMLYLIYGYDMSHYIVMLH